MNGNDETISRLKFVCDEFWSSPFREGALKGKQNPSLAVEKMKEIAEVLAEHTHRDKSPAKNGESIETERDVTVGEAIRIVDALGRVLGRDRNAHGVQEIANRCDRDGVAFAIWAYINATESQRREAEIIAGKEPLEQEEHFKPRSRC